ncbi:hypothetical protein BDV30DRAFT_221450 [Aspergillus minisclerotigenes]|uniref:Zn(2)-C6 fungal-type domain-containing protein n=1 Tax=Aspergillus minisclerotigenes TaxID=656917 RepID=A0A5N6IJT4_9EURO|nr:hypothetical protein BDV30DRAFT_221450 [Aspergillus minisclerotigenes]
MNSHAPPLRSGNGPSRVSCESCRAKKVRCPGEHPACSRCLSSNRECVYTMRMPMGRPKRRTTAKSARSRRREQLLTPTTRPHSGLSLGTDGDSAPVEPLEIGSAEQNSFVAPRPVRRMERAAAVSPYLVNPDNSDRAHTCLQHPETYTANISPIVNQPGTDPCACLSVLYLLLAQLRVKDRFTVPDDLTLLRDSISAATGVLNCRQCPLRYLCVMQNALVLGILCVCIAECYNKIMEGIDADERRAEYSQEKMRLRLSTTSDHPTYTGHTNPAHAPMPLSVEVSPSEWRSLMRNAVKAEIFGIGDDKEKCFMSLIDSLEERQKAWHRIPPAPDCPHIYRSVCHATDRKPTCLLVLEDARRIIQPLEL